jgi:hypothetical protein
MSRDGKGKAIGGKAQVWKKGYFPYVISHFSFFIAKA